MKRRRMNPRQRQGLMLVVIAAAGLLGVFLLIADYVSSVSKQVGAKITVVSLASPLSPYQSVQPNMLREVSVPQKWAPRNAVNDPDQVIGLVSQVPLSPGTDLQQGMLVPAPELSQGQRAMSVLVNADSGVGLQIQTGDIVDLLAAYQGSGQTGPASHDRAEVVVPSVRVLNVESPSGAGSGSASVPVILSVTPAQQQQILYAETFSAKFILTKVAPGSPAVVPPVYSPGQ
jgi:pilus assembly protein CpaB